MEIVQTSWLGVNSMTGFPDFNGELLSAKATPQERRQCFELVSELGSPPVRDLVMSWARVQRAPDAEYDFSLSDELVQQAQGRHVEIFALCLGTPGWAAGKKPASVFDFGLPGLDHEKDFRRFLAAFVERYDDDGQDDMPGLVQPLHAYEFLQEMEDIPAQEYAYWLRVFYETVHEADPQALVSVGGLRTPGVPVANEPANDDSSYLERLLAASSLSGPAYPYFDIVSFHNYPDSYAGSPPFEASLSYIRRNLAAHQVNKPIWLTEFGCQGGVGQEARQATDLVKWSLRARALGIERAFVYCLWDHHWTSNPASVENLGLVRETRSGEPPVRKPAFDSVRVLVHELLRRPDITRRDENLYVLEGMGLPSAYAVWSDPGSFPDQKFVDVGWWEVRTLDGRVTQQQAIDIRFGPTPMFVEKIKSPFLKRSDFQKQKAFPFKQIEELNEKGIGGNSSAP